MNIESLRIGMKVRHSQYGDEIVKALTEQMARVEFNDMTQELSPDISGLQPVEETAAIGGADRPLADLISEIVDAAYGCLPLSDPNESVDGLGKRWRGGNGNASGRGRGAVEGVRFGDLFHKIVFL